MNPLKKPPFFYGWILVAIAFLVLVGVLTIRPTGILGEFKK